MVKSIKQAQSAPLTPQIRATTPSTNFSKSHKCFFERRNSLVSLNILSLDKGMIKS